LVPALFAIEPPPSEKEYAKVRFWRVMRGAIPDLKGNTDIS
jgi:hypothetical protein